MTNDPTPPNHPGRHGNPHAAPTKPKRPTPWGSAIVGLIAVALVIVEFVGVEISPGPWIPYVMGAYGVFAIVYAVMRAAGQRWFGAISGLVLGMGVGSFFVLTDPSTINAAGFLAVVIGAVGVLGTALSGK